MTEEAPEKPRKIVVERIGPRDGLDVLTAKLAAAQAAVAPRAGRTGDRPAGG